MKSVNTKPLLRVAGMLALPLVLLAASACGDSAPAQGENATATTSSDKEDPTTERESLAGTEPAPEFPDGRAWFNVSDPLTMPDLRGKMVMLDFWTAGCINCQHIIPDLHRLEEEFGNRLVVIGVHSGKYEEEHEDDAVREAIERFGVAYPVVNDADFAIWHNYGVRGPIR